METTTAAVLALAQTHAAATKELAEYLEKRNTELGQLRTQVAERDKALAAYDAAQYSLDELRKKGTKDAAKGTAAEEKRDLAKAEYDSMHKIIDAELRELQQNKFVQFQARYDEFQAGQIALFTGMRNAWQLLFQEDYADTVAVPTPANILEKRRQWRDKSDKKSSKDEQRALKAKLADEKKRVKAEKKALRKSGAAIGSATAAAVAAGADGVPLACQVCNKRKVKARVASEDQVLYMCKTCTVEHQKREAAEGGGGDDDDDKPSSAAPKPPSKASDKPSDSAPPPPPPKKKKSLPPPPPNADEEEAAPAAEEDNDDDNNNNNDNNDDDDAPAEQSEDDLDLDSDTDVSDDEDNSLAKAPSSVAAAKSTAAALLIDDPFADDPFAMSSGAVLQPTPVLKPTPIAVLQPTPVLQPTHPAKPTRKVSQPVLPHADAVAATTTSTAAEPEFSRAELDGLTRRAGSWLNEAIKQLESGSFADAMLSANEAILCAAPACAMAAKGGTADELNQRRTELRMCVAYELATRVLCHVGLDRNYPISGDDANETLRATRGRFLADIPLRTAHRAACVRAGLKISADAKNWGAAADLIKMLLPLDPPDKERLMEQGRYCQSQGMTNAQFTPYKFMCFKQMRPITDAPMRCNVCNALFASATVRGRSQCPICKHGECAPLQ
jgi:hypothetical protein